MEKPDAETIALFDRLLPEDPRVVRSQMFGHPGGFVNGHIFFGTFAQTIIARVGADRATALIGDEYKAFEPLPGRPWREYVQFDPTLVAEDEARTLAIDALENAALLPPKPVKAKKEAAAKAAAPKAAAPKAAAAKSTAAKSATPKAAAPKAAAPKVAAPRKPKAGR
jgi:hypothetical protein